LSSVFSNFFKKNHNKGEKSEISRFYLEGAAHPPNADELYSKNIISGTAHAPAVFH
jgi:hypothetical protein